MPGKAAALGLSRVAQRHPPDAGRRGRSEPRQSNENCRLPYLGELVARKSTGTEQSILADTDVTFNEAEYERLKAELQVAYEGS